MRGIPEAAQEPALYSPGTSSQVAVALSLGAVSVIINHYCCCYHYIILQYTLLRNFSLLMKLTS